VALGGGGWAYSWGAQDDDRSIASMRRAIELGVNWIDTAAVYGLGHSEEVVGRLLRELSASQRPMVFTKCGLVFDERNPKAEPQRLLKPESIRKECDASLRRLGVERIDLYQFHWPDETGTPVEESWAEMVRLIEQGKIRMAGVSNFDVPALERCEAILHVDSLQPPFSLIHRDPATHEIPWCAEPWDGSDLLQPMHSGLLTDSFTKQSIAKFAEDDWRRRSPDFQEPKLSRNLGLRDCLRPIAQRHGTTVSAIAVAWVIAWQSVTGAIVGARSPQQVDGWIGDASLQLTAADLKEIANAIVQTGARTGPTTP
jgi:aryl-alcohol dehydrogenase-like predicted oxidoreductase